VKRSAFTTWEEFRKSEYGQLIMEHGRLTCMQLDGRDNKKRREEVYKKVMVHKKEWDAS